MNDTQRAQEQQAVEAIRAFPLPSQSASSEHNYRRILAWLYDGGLNSVASLVIVLGDTRP